jgi:hypothetical protein
MKKQLAVELEKISNQIDCLSNVLELLAIKIVDKESSTLWICHDVCESITSKLNTQILTLKGN